MPAGQSAKWGQATLYHTAGSDTFLFKSIWTRPQGCQGCQKNQKGTRINTLMCFCAYIQPKMNKLRKNLIKSRKSFCDGF